MAIDLSDLPDDVRDAIAPHIAETPDMLDAIGVAIAQKRDEAKSARTSSGIEQVWKDCEESYVGIDDANRLEFQDAKWSKPMSMDGPVSTGRSPRQTDHKSTAYIRLTARYVDAGSAKLGEILLPVDDKAFSFSETPVPELIKAKKDTSQVVHDGLGNTPLTRPAKPGEIPPQTTPPGAPTMTATPPTPPAPGPAPAQPPVGSASVSGAAPAGGAVLPAGAAAPAPPTAAPQVPLTVKDLAEENIELAHEAAKAAEKRVYDWMVDCQYPAEVRKLIFDAARIGVGVLKGPFPKPSKGIALSKTDDKTAELVIKESIKPAVKWADPWNIFPDPACGENIHNGDYIFERDYLSERQIRALKDVPGYIGTQIDKVLLEGPESANVNRDEGSMNSPTAAERKGRFEVWYYYGAMKRDEMDSISVAAGEKPAADGQPTDQVYAIVTLINSCVVRATINPLDSGSFPYHSVPWQRRSGHWAGIGVGEQIVTPQRMINAANRAMLNNAGKSAGSQIVVDQGSIKPADGSWVVTPDKIWYKTGDSTGNDVRESFLAVEIPNVTDELMKIINFALQLAEESTSIPLITQGQSGPTTPDTFGAAQLQNNNANQLLRAIGYAFDDYITEPVVRDFYEWLLLDPDVPEEEKGEFTINAHGSAALVERAIQDQTIAQMGPLVINPAYGMDPKKWAKLFLKSKRIDPEEVQYTEEEQAKLDAAPPPVDPAVQVAQINASVARDQIVAKQQTDQRTTQNEQQIAAAAQALDGKKVDTEQSRVQVEATVKLHELQMRHDIAMLDYANRHQINLDQVKSNLAKTAMTLDAQRELNAADNAAELSRHGNDRQPAPQPKHRQRRPSRQAAQPIATGMSKVVANDGRAPPNTAFEQ